MRHDRQWALWTDVRAPCEGRTLPMSMSLQPWCAWEGSRMYANGVKIVQCLHALLCMRACVQRDCKSVHLACTAHTADVLAPPPPPLTHPPPPTPIATPPCTHTHARPPMCARRALGWSCGDDCRYSCMWWVEEQRRADGAPPAKYFGKWPFVRVGGAQEVASTVFSVGNLVPHARALLLRRHVVAPAHLPAATLLRLFSLVGVLTWSFSAAFHARDVWVRARCCATATPTPSHPTPDYGARALFAGAGVRCQV
jgi:hypothetical protein